MEQHSALEAGMADCDKQLAEWKARYKEAVAKYGVCEDDKTETTKLLIELYTCCAESKLKVKN